VRDVERHVTKAAFAGENEPFAREMLQRRLDAPCESLERFNLIAALVNHAEREVRP